MEAVYVLTLRKYVSYIIIALTFKTTTYATFPNLVWKIVFIHVSWLTLFMTRSNQFKYISEGMPACKGVLI